MLLKSSGEVIRVTDIELPGGVFQDVHPKIGQSSPGRARTSDTRINSPLLYRLSYRGMKAQSL